MISTSCSIARFLRNTIGREADRPSLAQAELGSARAKLERLMEQKATLKIKIKRRNVALYIEKLEGFAVERSPATTEEEKVSVANKIVEIRRDPASNGPIEAVTTQDDALAYDIQAAFDSLIIFALTGERKFEIEADLIDFVETLPQQYIEAVEPAYIVALLSRSLDEFLNAMSVQRLACYAAMGPIRADIDPTLSSSNPEWYFHDLAAELKVPRKALLAALWPGRWRHASYWGNEFLALRLEIRNQGRRERRDEQRKRELDQLSEPVESSHHEMSGVDEDDFQNSMEKALYRAWRATSTNSDPAFLRGGADWNLIGKRTELPGAVRRLLVERSHGTARRNADNAAAWRTLGRAYPKLAEVITELQQPEIAVDHPLIEERIAEKNKIFQFKGLKLK